MSSQTRYKGRFIKDKVLSRMEKCKRGLARKREERNLQTNSTMNLISEAKRVVDKNFKCQKCQQILSLENIKSERRKELHSILVVECHGCSSVIHAHARKDHTVNEEAICFFQDKKHNDVTTKVVLDVPSVSWKLYRKYEDEVKPTIEKAAKRSCTSAAKEEHKSMIVKAEDYSFDYHLNLDQL